MTKRDLQQYRALCDEANTIKAEIERLQTSVQSPRLTGMPHGGGDPDRVGSLVAKKVDLENRLMDRVERLYELRNKIEDAMERLSGSTSITAVSVYRGDDLGECLCQDALFLEADTQDSCKNFANPRR